jgi:hypothetical protein
MTTDTPWAQPIGLSRDPYWDDAWTNENNEYVLPHPDNEFESLRAGRASELGKVISNTFTLNRWHKEMVLRGVVARRSILQRAAIALHDGLTKKQASKQLWDLCKEAEDVAGSKEPAALGTGFHKLTELYDARKVTLEEVPEPWDRDMLAYAEVLHRAGIVAVPEFTERIVWNRPINTAGRFDRLWCYLRHCDRWHVGDVKTGRDLQYGWLEILIQLQAYATATHIFHADPPKFGPKWPGEPEFAYLVEQKTPDQSYWSAMPEMCTDVGLVLHVPSSGMVDEEGEPTGGRMGALYEVDLTTRIEFPLMGYAGKGVNPTELAVAVQQYQKVRRVARLICRVEVTEAGEVRDAPLTLSELIDLTTTRAELEELWADRKARKEWKGHHTIRARKQMETLAS